METEVIREGRHKHIVWCEKTGGYWLVLKSKKQYELWKS